LQEKPTGAEEEKMRGQCGSCVVVVVVLKIASGERRRTKNMSEL
jgi:hypothetical protein